MYKYKLCTIIYTLQSCCKDWTSVHKTLSMISTRAYSLYTHLPPLFCFCCFWLGYSTPVLSRVTERTQGNDVAAFRILEERQSGILEPSQVVGAFTIQTMIYKPINLLVLLRWAESFHWCLSAAKKGYPSLEPIQTTLKNILWRHYTSLGPSRVYKK